MNAHTSQVREQSVSQEPYEPCRAAGRAFRLECPGHGVQPCEARPHQDFSDIHKRFWASAVHLPCAPHTSLSQRNCLCGQQEDAGRLSGHIEWSVQGERSRTDTETCLASGSQIWPAASPWSPRPKPFLADSPSQLRL